MSLVEEKDECSAFSSVLDFQDEVPTELTGQESSEASESLVIDSLDKEDSPTPLDREVMNPVRKKSRNETSQTEVRQPVVEEREEEMSSFGSELEEKQRKIDELQAEVAELRKEKEERLKEIQLRQTARRKAKEERKRKAKEEAQKKDETTKKAEEEKKAEEKKAEEKKTEEKKKKGNPVGVPEKPVFEGKSVDQVGTSNFVSFTAKLAINSKFKKYQKHFEKGHLLSTKDFDFLEDENGYVMVYRYKGTSQNIEIPSYVGESAVMYLHPNFLSSVLNPLNDSRFRGLKRSLQEVDTTSFTNTRFSSILVGAKSIRLPDKLQAIPPFAFSGCSKLRRLIVPDTVGTIAPDAFENCGVQEIVLLGDCPANFQLVSLPAGCKVYCRKECLKSYEAFVLQQNRRSSRVYKQLVRS